jgi:hypothetical protein
VSRSPKLLRGLSGADRRTDFGEETVRLAKPAPASGIVLALNHDMLFGEQDGDLSGMTRRALSCGLSLSGREHPFQVFSVVEPDFSHAVVALIAGGRQVDGVSLESGKPLDERRMFLQPPLLKRFQADAVGSFENADQLYTVTPSVILAMRRLVRRDPYRASCF